MWYKVDSKGFTWDELLCLYRVVDARERGFREDLFRFTNFYSAVCFAILGITLSGFVNFYDKGLILLSLLFGPALTICMCFLGLRVTGQIFGRIQAETSTKAKLENLLGLDTPIKVTEFMGDQTIWKNDESLLPSRHAKRRFEEESSDKFIAAGSHRKGGANTNNFIYFSIIGVFSLLLGITIVVCSFIKIA